MGTWDNILSVLKEPVEGKFGIWQVHNFLVSRGKCLDIGGDLLRDLPNDDEPLVEEIYGDNECLYKIALWPTLGSVDYSFPGFLIGVHYLSYGGAMLEGVQISVSDKQITGHPDYESEFKQLAIDLHILLKAQRTIMGWELDDVGFGWEEEIARVRAGVFREDEQLELDLRGTHLPEMPNLPDDKVSLKNFNGINLFSSEFECMTELDSLLDKRIEHSDSETPLGFIAESGHVKQLRLEHQGLAILPWSIGNLKNLRELRLQSNCLNALPETIGRLTSLQVLAVQSNHLNALPEAIGQLSSLESLSLQSNCLEALPETIGQLSLLKSLSHSAGIFRQGVPGSRQVPRQRQAQRARRWHKRTR